MINTDNRNYITSIKYINSASKTILPILLISKINILYNWCYHNNLEDNIVISITETSYANDDTILK